MTVKELIKTLQMCDPDEQCYVRINDNLFEIDDVYGVADANYYVIHRLCVSSHFQKQGIGTRTVQHIEEQAKNIGAETIRLDAFTLNPHALKLYEKLGYREVGIANFRKGKFYLMEKKLSE